MKILILGGTGAMGIYLVDILAEAGNQVDVTSRRQREDKENIHYIQGNAHSIDFMKQILSTKRYNAIVDFMTYTTIEFQQRYKMYLENTDQYFLLSTSRVYADSPIIRETSPRLLDVVSDKDYLKTDEYALTKARQEDILNNSGKKNYTIIRPYMTYSDNRLQLGVLDKDTFIQRALKGRSVVIPKDIMSHSTTLTYGFDVSSCIANLIGNSKAFGETFHITTDKTIKWMNVVNVYMTVFEKKIGFRPKIIMIDQCPQLWTNLERYQVLYDRLYNRSFDNSKIIDAVGGYEFTEPTVGLTKCMESFLVNPSFSNLMGKIEGIHDHYSHEFTSLNEFTSNKNKISYLLYRLAPASVAKLILFIKGIKK